MIRKADETIDGLVSEDGGTVTYKGPLVTPTKMTIDDVDIEHIAHALALTCRYNGACQVFYSNAQHSVLVSKRAVEIAKSAGISGEVPLNGIAMLALMHDGHEAYNQDMIRPRKRMLQRRFPDCYRFLDELDRKVQRLIDEHTGVGELTDNVQVAGFVKQADNDVTRYESKCIMADRGETWAWNGTSDLLAGGWEPLQCLEWEDAEQLFLEVFCELSAAIKPQLKPVDMTPQQVAEASGWAHAVAVIGPGVAVDSWEGRLDTREFETLSGIPGEPCQSGTIETSPKPEADRRTHETGATRSTDADGVRFDLITPVALREIRKHQRRFVDVAKKASELVETACDAMLLASYGQWDSGQLERAAYCLLDAINEIEGGEFCGDGLPFRGMERLAAVYKEGADKYSDHNWLRGFPVSDLLNHAIRHLFLWLGGDRSEDHLGHACWGVFASIHSYHEWPHLNQNLRKLSVDA
jgi:hypothetical protein